MLDTASWPEIELQVLKEIHLDPRNVRLESADAKVEADILADLFANENALGLVEGIARVGYLTHEVPIVVKRRGKYVVVEGNRRVAALKAIQNPLLVPEFQARVTAQVKTIPNVRALSSIKVQVAPNQSAADQIIAAIHTSNLRKPWTRPRQAAFFQAQLDAHRSYAELLERYPTIDVKDFVLRSRISSLLTSVTFDDNELDDFAQSRAWKRGSSTVERIYESKDFLDLTGVRLDDRGNLKHQLNASQVKAVATVILGGMKSGDLTTRTLNTVKSPRFTQLVSELKDAVSENGPIPATARPAKKAAKRAAAKKSPRATTGRGPTSRYISLGAITVPDDYPVALRSHYEELTILDYKRFPNTAFLLLRAILEKTIKAFADEKHVEIRAVSQDGKGFVQLHHALAWLGTYAKDNGQRSLIQPINRIQTGRLSNYTVTNDALNAINHNHRFEVDPDDVLSSWNAMEPILRFVTRP